MRRLAAAMALSVAAVAAGAPPAAAQHAPRPSPSAIEYELEEERRNEAGQPDSERKEEPGFFDVEGRVKKAISEWFAELVTAALEPVFALLSRTVFSTPQFDEHERIRQLWRYSLAIANASLSIFVLVGAGMVTVSGDVGTHLTVKEALPRLLVAAGASNVSMIALREMIQLSNALSRGILQSLDSEEIGAAMADRLFEGSYMNPFLALLALFVIVLGVLVAITYVMRLAIQVVLAVAGPLLLIAHALPHSENWAKIWWRGTVSLLAVPVAQSFLVVVAFQVFLSGDGIRDWSQGSLIDMLVIGCILWLLFKLPLWGLDAAIGGSSSKVWRRTRHVVTTVARASVTGRPA